MADLFEIELADGIPVAGDGNVKTINSLMEDGALATIGFRTDPAVPNSGPEPASVIALLKQISKTLQDMREDWPSALGTGGGLKVDGSGTPVPVTGNVNITQNAAAVALTSFTNGSAAYPSGAVVGVGGGNAALQLVGIAPGATTIKIISASLEIDRAAVITGETTYRLYLFNVSPPSALIDGAVFDLSNAADRNSFLGYIDFPALLDAGATLYIEINNINKLVRTASAHIFAYLVTIGPFTSSPSFYKVTLAAEQK